MKVELFDDRCGTYMFECPAGHTHYINTKVPNHLNAQWWFNGDVNNPTFKPSIDEKSGTFTPGYINDTRESNEWVKNNSYRCHFIITDGKIHFCGDCSHDLKGKVVNLPEINPQL